ncbi:hypothetical protein AURDEDRAFT_127132 [Auricularia subglabra TFB-10046 SS5]|uniref:Uncharacterized protein n=1 Tax=Auricularia subglabra (strain TFB-10046 / SS5) TaxID=717982 RepID=J0WXD8_AURST|nr:hypothetical protein AURDEDRAFT_127132 [Auricularia subglabra TFB-10046 SS5]
MPPKRHSRKTAAHQTKSTSGKTKPATRKTALARQRDDTGTSIPGPRLFEHPVPARIARIMQNVGVRRTDLEGRPVDCVDKEPAATTGRGRGLGMEEPEEYPVPARIARIMANVGVRRPELEGLVAEYMGRDKCTDLIARIRALEAGATGEVGQAAALVPSPPARSEASAAAAAPITITPSTAAASAAAEAECEGLVANELRTAVLEHVTCADHHDQEARVPRTDLAASSFLPLRTTFPDRLHITASMNAELNALLDEVSELYRPKQNDGVDSSDEVEQALPLRWPRLRNEVHAPWRFQDRAVARPRANELVWPRLTSEGGEANALENCRRAPDTCRVVQSDSTQAHNATADLWSSLFACDAGSPGALHTRLRPEHEFWSPRQAAHQTDENARPPGAIREFLLRGAACAAAAPYPIVRAPGPRRYLEDRVNATWPLEPPSPVLKPDVRGRPPAGTRAAAARPNCRKLVGDPKTIPDVPPLRLPPALFRMSWRAPMRIATMAELGRMRRAAEHAEPNDANDEDDEDSDEGY